jgi:hypothetical protein
MLLRLSWALYALALGACGAMAEDERPCTYGRECRDMHCFCGDTGYRGPSSDAGVNADGTRVGVCHAADVDLIGPG